MTFTHVVFRPHKKFWHNILELGIFLDLLFVNTVSLLNYAVVIWGDADSIVEVSLLVWLQIIAVVLPTLYLVMYATVTVLTKLAIAIHTL